MLKTAAAAAAMCRVAIMLLILVGLSHQWTLPTPRPCLKPASMCRAGSSSSSTLSKAATAPPTAVRNPRPSPPAPFPSKLMDVVARP